MPVQEIIYSQTPGFVDATLIITAVVPRLVSLIFSDIENELYDPCSVMFDCVRLLCVGIPCQKEVSKKPKGI